MRRKRGFGLIVAGVICLLGAIGLNAYNILDAQHAGKTAVEGFNALVEYIEAERTQSSDANSSSSSASSASASSSSLSSASSSSSSLSSASPSSAVTMQLLAEQQARELPVAMIDGYSYTAVVEIPSLGLSLPVMSEWSYANLKISPCRYAGSPYNNDLVLCAHNYTTHFGELRWVEMGEDVYYTDVNGETIHYVIVNRETLNPDEVDYLTDPEAEWDLTLFTCYGTGATRCVIRCNRAD